MAGRGLPVEAGDAGTAAIDEDAMIFRPYYYFDTAAPRTSSAAARSASAPSSTPATTTSTPTSRFAAAKGMRITHVIDTHVHADHRSGGPALARTVGAAYCLHESADVALPFTPLRDGEEIELGNTRVKVLHTPGHSPESICLVVTDLQRGTEPWFVLTGDTLFVGAVGRPDLPGRARENAAQLYDSIHDEAADAARRPRGLSRPLLRLGLRRRHERQADEHDRLREALEPDAVARSTEAFVEALVRRAAEAGRDGARSCAFNRGRRDGRTRERQRRTDRRRSGSACARTSRSSRCSSSSTRSSARWSAWSAASCPRIAEQEFHLAARTAVLSFIVVFGVTKALTNYCAGRLSDRFGRKHVLVAAGSSRRRCRSC